MEKEKSNLVEETLRKLTRLQLIDSRIDEIHILRGELPEDEAQLVRKIAAQIESLEAQKKASEEEVFEIKKMTEGIANYNREIDALQLKQKNVQNDREYTALESEIEYKQLEIQLFEKKIRKAKASTTERAEEIKLTEEKVGEFQDRLDLVRSKLQDILSQTQKEEEFLQKKRDDFANTLDVKSLHMYQRIRDRFPNKLAVVTLDRGAAIGSYIAVPPQVQIDMRLRKEVIFDEHSGRILVDNVLMDEEKELLENTLASV